MITFFTIPRPFNAKYMDIQYRAISSWTRFPGEVILFGDEHGTEEAVLDLNCRWYQKVKRLTTTGPPLIDSVFKDAQLAARYDVMCYVNADIFFYNDDIPDLIQECAEQFESFLTVGRRWDPAAPWSPKLHAGVPVGGYHCVHGEDYFFFPRGTYPFVPPFLIGRSAWDNWLVLNADMRGIPTIDATQVITAIHLGETKRHHEHTQEYAYNQDIWHRYGGVDEAGYTDDTEWVFTKDGLKER